MKKQLKPIFFLKTNISLLVDNRKLINFLVHELLMTLESLVLTQKQQKGVLLLTVSRFHLHKSLDIKGKIKFRLSKIVNELTSEKLFLANHYKSSFIQELSLDKKNITFKLNPTYNKYLFDSPFFAIDQEMQRKITRKNTLFLYELCMSNLTKITNHVSDNDVIEFEESIKDLITILGSSDYKYMRNIDIYRTVFLVSAEDLNRVEPGFIVEINSNIVYRVIDSLSFKLKVIDSEYVNEFITITQ